ncbi:MAG TPA: hydrogenase expression/formation protein HypE [Bacillota bacterium]|nr:hydrogenase expression/formation protein HypE [Bacillota bacterium]
MTDHNDSDIILLAHGDGGLLTHRLLKKHFLPRFNNEFLSSLSDASVFDCGGGCMAVSTDSFVVDPIFFPGGDIGKLAVCGTVNDLAVSGARPLYLTASFIIEEGFLLSDLERIIISMSEACSEAGVIIIAGDTKVVGRGQADKIFINTTGIGTVLPQANLGYSRIAPGDLVLVNGCLGNHGLSIILQRESLGLKSRVLSDCAPLNRITGELVRRFTGIKFMRDLTRGGLATNAKETAMAADVDFWLDEDCLPVEKTVKAACDLLGLDPLYLANEGKFLAVAEAGQAGQVLQFLQKELRQEARIIGEIKAGSGNVFLRTSFGGTRRLNLLAGAPLPRIC